jgi:hypothetical protein
VLRGDDDGQFNLAQRQREPVTAARGKRHRGCLSGAGRLTASVPHCFLGFLIGAVNALYDFETHIRGGSCVSRNRAYNPVNTRREGMLLHEELGLPPLNLKSLPTPRAVKKTSKRTRPAAIRKAS